MPVYSRIFVPCLLVAFASTACKKSERQPASGKTAAAHPKLGECLFSLTPESKNYRPSDIDVLAPCARIAGLYVYGSLRMLEQLIQLDYMALKESDAKSRREIDQTAADLLGQMRASNLFCSDEAERAFMAHRPARPFLPELKLDNWLQVRDLSNWLEVLAICGPQHYGIPADQAPLLAKNGHRFARWVMVQRTVQWIAEQSARADALTRTAAAAALRSLELSMHRDARTLYVNVEPQRLTVSIPHVLAASLDGARLDIDSRLPESATPVELAALDKQMSSWRAVLKERAERRALTEEERQTLAKAREAGAIRPPAQDSDTLQLGSLRRVSSGNTDKDRPGRQQQSGVQLPAPEAAPVLLLAHAPGQKPTHAPPGSPANAAKQRAIEQARKAGVLASPASAPGPSGEADNETGDAQPGSQLRAARVLAVAAHLPSHGATLGRPGPLFAAYQGPADRLEGPARFAHVLLTEQAAVYWGPDGERREIAVTRLQTSRLFKEDAIDVLLVGATESVPAARLEELLDTVPSDVALLPTPGRDERYGGLIQ